MLGQQLPPLNLSKYFVFHTIPIDNSSYDSIAIDVQGVLSFVNFLFGQAITLQLIIIAF